MELGKRPQKFLHSVETLIFYEFLKIENSALFQNTTEQQNHLRTFARNFSNIDFFLKILPLKDHELATSEM